MKPTLSMSHIHCRPSNHVVTGWLSVSLFIFYLLVWSADANWEKLNTTNNTAFTPRESACFVMVQDKAYLIGGRGVKWIDVYDSVTNVWTRKAGPPIELHHIQCVVYNRSKIYIPTAWTGVYPNERSVPKLFIYDTVNDVWSNQSGLPSARLRGSSAVVIVGQDIYVSHGSRGGHGTTGAPAVGWLDKYSILHKNWTSLADAPNPRDHAGGGLLVNNGTRKICVVGGRENGVADFFNRTVLPSDCYHIASDTWSVEAKIPQGRAGSAYAVSCDGKLLVAGGEGYGQAFSNVDAFDGKSWLPFDSLLQPRHGTGLAISCNSSSSSSGGRKTAIANPGVMYIAGGAGSEGGLAKLSGTEVWSMTDSTIRINSGGNAFTDINGKKWMADKYFDGGSKFGVSFDILGTQLDQLYQTERRGNFSYNIPVGQPGSYGIRLHMAEIVYKQSGRRVFDVLIQDKVVLNNLDLAATVGFQRKQDYLTSVQISGKTIKIKVIATTAGQGKISGLQIWEIER